MFEKRLKTSLGGAANFNRYPLASIAVCFALGILAGNFLAFGWKIPLAIWLVFATLSAVFLKKPLLSVILLLLAFIFAGAVYIQITEAASAENRLKKLYDGGQIKSGDAIEIEGVLQSKPEIAAGGFFIEIKTEKAIYKNAETSVSGKVRLFASTENKTVSEDYEALNMRSGVKIRAAVRLRREDRFLNPGVSQQREILDQSEIDATGIIKSPLLIEKLSNDESFSPLGKIFDLRNSLIVEFRNNFNVSTAGVLIASLLGNKYFLDKPTAEVFREGGTFHVLVISGLHITFTGVAALFFIQFLTKKRTWQFLIVCAVLWIYAIAVGANVPVVRAALMFTILLFSKVIYRQGTLLNSLGACALVLLVWRPNDLFTQSFQLTFMSVAALVIIGFPLLEKLDAVGAWTLSADTPVPPRSSVWLKRFCETVYWRENVWKMESARNLWSANLFKSPYVNWSAYSAAQMILRYVFEMILVSLIVQICLLPLMIIYFNRVSFAGVLLNLWVGIIIAIESFTAIFAIFLAQINDVLAFPFIKITEFLNWLLIEFPRLFVENSWASFRVPTYSGAMRVVYFLYFLPVIILAFLLYRWNPFRKQEDEKTLFGNLGFSLENSFVVKSTVCALIVLFGLIVFHPNSAAVPDGRLRVDFLDVGQGDAALITFPDGVTMLVDSGGKISNFQAYKSENEDDAETFEPDTQSIGEAVVSKFLWLRGYDSIDYLLATHADADHIQGFQDVAKNFSVRAALFGRTPTKNQEFAAVYEILRKRDIPIVNVSRGDILNFDSVKIEVLSPEKADSSDAPSDNNHSIVFLLSYGSRKILLTGDVEKETERELLNAPETIKTDVIKVAHHGSRTSSIEEFVAATGAKLAVISVGRTSQFGHPHREVIERWKQSGAQVITTGERGTVSISTDGEDLQLKTFQR